MKLSDLVASATLKRSWLAVAAAVLIGTAAAPSSAVAETFTADLAIATHLDSVEDGSDLFVEVGGFHGHRFGKFRGHGFSKFRGHRFGKFRGHGFSKFRGNRFGKFRGGRGFSKFRGSRFGKFRGGSGFKFGFSGRF